MRYTLKDYQAQAVREVLRNLDRARDSYRRYGALSQFSLTATTGAGKTVMAAAVIEALFFGSDEFDFAGDPGAVVLWVSDDPALNEQSRARIHRGCRIPRLPDRAGIAAPKCAQRAAEQGATNERLAPPAPARKTKRLCSR